MHSAGDALVDAVRIFLAQRGQSNSAHRTEINYCPVLSSCSGPGSGVLIVGMAGKVKVVANLFGQPPQRARPSLTIVMAVAAFSLGPLAARCRMANVLSSVGFYFPMKCFRLVLS